jgi:hypothetical protein
VQRPADQLSLASSFVRAALEQRRYNVLNELFQGTANKEEEGKDHGCCTGPRQHFALSGQHFWKRA